MAVVPTTRDNPICCPSPRSAKLHSRRGVQDYALVSRVDAREIDLPQYHPDPGPMHSGPVCHSPQQPTGQVCQLASRPVCDGNGRLCYVMAGGARVRISPILPNKQVPAEGPPRPLLNSAGNPLVGRPAMVSSPSGSPGRLPLAAAQPRSAPGRPLQPDTPVSGPRKTSASRLESIRNIHLAEGLSERASALIRSGWSKGTNTAYESGWTKWASWRTARQIDPISGDVQHFVDILAELYDQGLQHRSINSIRSAVSMTHKPVEGRPIGQHPLVTRLLKGIYNRRPPQPRYSATWDVDIVTRYIANLGSNESLSLKQLSQKLVVLMALVEASRTSELKALDMRFRVYKPNGVGFKLASLTKKRTPGLPPKELFFGAFPDDKRLCVVECLKEYEQRTQKFRETTQEKPCATSYITETGTLGQRPSEECGGG